jgi:cation diffusion facilitator family transporter
MAAESNRAIYASIAANIVIAIAKFVGAALSGSSAMIAEGVHSLVDSSDGTLLLVGRWRSKQPPDDEHPFGHGKELYFWTLLVAIVFFAVGGGMSIYEGVLHLLHPEPLRDPTISYIVLGVATVFDGGSFIIALRELRASVPDKSIANVVRNGKDPSVFTVVLEDVADLTGLGIAFLSLWLEYRFNAPWIDGVGSIGIGLVLATVALILVTESKALLVGERAHQSIIEALQRAAKYNPGVRAVARPLSMQLGPHEVLLAVGMEFAPELSAADIAMAIDQLEARVRQEQPDVKHIYIEVESLRRTQAPVETS